MMKICSAWNTISAANVRFSVNVFLFLVIAVFASGPLSGQPTRKKAEQTRGPVSLAEIKEVLRMVQHKTVTEDRLIDLIRKHGVADITDEELHDLSQRGASDALVEVIKEKRPVPPPPPQPLQGTLSISCSPPECTVTVNGRDSNATTDGKLKITAPVGRAALDVSKEGYVAKHEEVEIKGASPITLSFTLDLAPATKMKYGLGLYDTMVRALGATDIKKFGDFAGVGSITTFNNNSRLEWEFKVAMAPPNLLQMTATAASGTVLFRCRGEQCMEGKKRPGFFGKSLKPPPEAIAQSVQQNLRAFSRFNLAAILRDLNAGAKFSAETNDPPGVRVQHLRAEARDTVYEITVDQDFLPSEIIVEPKSGLESVKIIYGGYKRIDTSQFPCRTGVSLSDSAKNGIEVRLENINSRSGLTETDFQR
jgi:hypothetical protein